MATAAPAVRSSLATFIEQRTERLQAVLDTRVEKDIRTVAKKIFQEVNGRLDHISDSLCTLDREIRIIEKKAGSNPTYQALFQDLVQERTQLTQAIAELTAFRDTVVAEHTPKFKAAATQTDPVEPESKCSKNAINSAIYTTCALAIAAVSHFVLNTAK